MNAELPFASGRAFRAKHTTVVSITGCGAAFVIASYLVTLMQLSSEGWHAFLWGLLITIGFLTPLGQYMQARADREVAAAIDACAAGDASPEQIRAGYRALTKLPLRDVLWSAGNYFLAGLFLPLFMIWYLGDLSAFATGVLLVGSMTGGFATAPFLYLAVKRMGDSLREVWASSLSTDERAELGRALPLHWKLAVPMSLVGTVIVIFCGMLAFSLSQQPVEVHDTRSKAAFLDYAVEALEAEEGTSLEELRVLARRHFVAEELLVVDRATGEVLDGEEERLTAIELSHALSSVEIAGNSASLSSDSSFAWKVARGGKVLVVAVTHGSAFTQAVSGSILVFALLLVFTVGFSVAVALGVARDVAGTTDRLRRLAERVATGDLRQGTVVESEDELGALARSFDVMLGSLRETIGRVANASQEVDASAAELAGAGQVVAESTNDQSRGLEQATLSMGSINQQVAGITDSAQVLNGNVEEASSSVLELGAASEELNQTASALNTQVEEVSSSIEQMVRSVSQIAENNDGLASAIEETSTSMSEMAAAMREVESNANETSRLSSHVVELADGGRERVQQTIAGMEQIRDATETAEQVIQGLAGRMQEIGAIVDVIDDVADETNLLALNAAIIAAQAGDQGRSFSVVADEIKDLADRVLSSTKEIGGLIDSVQAESGRATTAIHDGAERVQHGVDLSAEAGLSLEQITSAARDSGGRIEQIVHSVQEQSRATAHVAGLMERVSSRVEEIRGAGREQEHGNEVVMRGAVMMRDVAQQTHRTTEEQSRGAIRIRDSIESVRDAVDRIHASLQEQSEACRSAVSFLEQVHERTRANDRAADQMRGATGELEQQALALRTEVQGFRIE